MPKIKADGYVVRRIFNDLEEIFLHYSKLLDEAVMSLLAGEKEKAIRLTTEALILNKEIAHLLTLVSTGQFKEAEDAAMQLVANGVTSK